MRQSESGWRKECLDKRGRHCRVCGRSDGLEVDHLVPKGMGGNPGVTVVENGLVLCRDHHRAKTEHRLLIQRRWLDDDQLEWLATEGHCQWLDGHTLGRHRRLFQEER